MAEERTIEITELWGDGIGPELRESVHEVAALLPLDLHFHAVDLSLENRERRGEALYDEAEESIRRTRLALKYPTVTRRESPNAVLRRRCGFSVIHRPVISIRGIDSNFKEDVALHIVRVATGGTYDDPGQLVSRDVAVSLRVVERGPCEQAARYAFDFARRKDLGVTSASKHTIQRVTDGLFESVVANVARGFPDVPHRVELFDALLAKIILQPQAYQVVLCLNEYGDFLSDMACGLVGSLGTGASGNFSFDEQGDVELAMFDPAGGTAPDIAGQNRVNPTAALLAVGLLLDHLDRYDLGHALRLAILESIAAGGRTRDVGGKLSTREFTREICERMPALLEV
ncbi:MAG: isocitrate/isopropylmalate family dehydrogenase [Myxococcota bacterium]